MTTISPAVQRALGQVTQELGDHFALPALLHEVAARRGKRLAHMVAPLPSGVTGFCLALKDVDLICVDQDLQPDHALLVQLHELGHLLLSHLPRWSLGPHTPTHAEFLANPDLMLARCRSLHGEQQERDAELLATLLLGSIHRFAQAPATFAADLFGAP